jgi:hypothetical protein
MKTRITILCENSVGKRVGPGEHGFSAFQIKDFGTIDVTPAYRRS